MDLLLKKLPETGLINERHQGLGSTKRHPLPAPFVGSIASFILIGE